MNDAASDEPRRRRTWLRASAIADYVRRMTARGQIDAVRLCACGHPWGLHCVEDGRCLISRCGCATFDRPAALDAEHF